MHNIWRCIEEILQPPTVAMNNSQNLGAALFCILIGIKWSFYSIFISKLFFRFSSQFIGCHSIWFFQPYHNLMFRCWQRDVFFLVLLRDAFQHYLILQDLVLSKLIITSLPRSDMTKVSFDRLIILVLFKLNYFTDEDK